jgi:phosphoglycolate phosphatase-like HAD superfamily hydrolase
MSKVKAVILDIDGTLIDSNDAHARAFVEGGAEMGIEVEFDTVRRLIGKGGDKLIPEVFGFEQESERGEELDERKGRIFRDRYLPTLAPTPGARALLERFLKVGLELVVATSASGDDLKGLLERAGVEDLVDQATSASDVEETKPAPDPVKSALEKVGRSAGEAIMLGDTPYDVQSATTAGVVIVGVRSGGWSAEELRGAAAVYDDPADLLRNYESSPFGQG